MPKFDLSCLGPLKEGWRMPMAVDGREVRLWVCPGDVPNSFKWVPDQDTPSEQRDAYEAFIRGLIWELLPEGVGEKDLLPDEDSAGA